MPIVKVLDGNHAAAEAMRQINPDVVAAYPITPTSYIMEAFSVMVNNGAVETEFVTVESEHAAMSACIGACAAGGRVMTATASQGLAFMHEALFNASGMRLPIVLINGNRALGAPLSIHCDHSDCMAERDTGFLQLHAKDAQEMYDLLFQAFRIAEDESVRTPIMICMDAFQVTHTHQKVTIEDDEAVQKFIGKPILKNPLLDIENPVSYGGATRPDFYHEARRSQLEGILNAFAVIPAVGEEFGKAFGRDYSSFGEMYELEDAEYAVVVLGSTFGAVKKVIDERREKGEKVGALRLRTFRPFPGAFVRECLDGKKGVAVMDRTSPVGAEGGPLFMEVRSALYDLESRPRIFPFVYGLGSRETSPANIHDIFEVLISGVSEKREIFPEESFWVNLRG
ncbi:MAG: pyruvate ferredoxin oxidoreductase [Candidatus Peregrinibacteria bacterium]